MPPSPPATPESRPLLRVLAMRGGLLGLAWAVLVGDRPGGLWMGLLAVPLALWVSVALSPPSAPRVRPLALARLLPRFIAWAMAGSADVALRALRPRMPIAPGCVEVPVRLPSLPARIFLSSVASLIPGSLGVEIGEEHATMHLLDTRPRAREAAVGHLRTLERHVAAIFGHPLPPGGPP